VGWKETCVQDERLLLVQEFATGERSRAEICRRYGDSRKTGYKWPSRGQPLQLFGPDLSVFVTEWPNCSLSLVLQRSFSSVRGSDGRRGGIRYRWRFWNSSYQFSTMRIVGGAASAPSTGATVRNRSPSAETS
jgi:hypothetical protein